MWYSPSMSPRVIFWWKSMTLTIGPANPRAVPVRPASRRMSSMLHR